jgi:hypothetical protein
MIASTTVDRRKLLMGLAVGLALATTAGIAIAAPAADPIFASIDEHLAMIRERDSARAMSAPWPELRDLFALEGYAALCVVETAPTTMAGLRALEAHLDLDGDRLHGPMECLRIIRNRWLESQPNCEMSDEDVAYVRAAPANDYKEFWRRYYQRPREAFIVDRRSEIDRAA